ncbi:MAG: DUF4421 domain-containing protein [Paramuribaculum sp.]|nr:DUF4421 domain-containing protein [Paramuribaculum sp.]
MRPLNIIRLALVAALAVTGANPLYASADDRKDKKAEAEADSAFFYLPELADHVDTTLLKDLRMTRAGLDSAEFAQLPWFKQLYKSGFNINAPGINYPKFPRFVVNVYNWADHFFNGFDPEYVTGTGYNFKAYVKSYNWFQSYRLYFSRNNYLRIRSDIYSDLGPNISYKAVTLGYMADLRELGHGKIVRRKNFDLDFTCGLFSANLNIFSTKGATKITHFGDMSMNRSLDFDGVNEKSTEFTAYYFFNHRKYSQGAAYNMSRYQYRSQGSWIAGVNMSHRRIDLDFSTLPESMLEEMPELYPYYSFRYNSYNLVFGYGYNWVLRPKTWLINITALPVIGYMHSFEGTTEGRKDLFSTNPILKGAVVYNHRALFVTGQVNFQGSFIFTKGYTFFDSLTSFTATVGVRF